MRIKRISVGNIAPIKQFDVDDLSDLVVIAGPNGVGKTRLVGHLLQYFQHLSPGDPNFTIEATSSTESEAWGKNKLETLEASDAKLLAALLHQNRRRRNFTSSVIYYESNRSIQKVNPLNFQFDFPDPWEESVSWKLSFGGLVNRWPDTQHAIFKKIQSQKTSIANRAIQLRDQGHTQMNLGFNDPLEPFRDAFAKLLGPKELHRADVQNQQLIYLEGSEERDIKTLSSGEREVLNITFDFILRKPSHSVVFFDEPELHLHPELLARLITTLRTVGESNQFILISHSPEVIASSLDDTVIFLTPPREDLSNQAVVLKEKDSAAEALHRLGQSVGVISLGKKIVLIEGKDSSLDKKTYSHILANRFPGLVLLPSGGKGNLNAFDAVAREILGKALWGIRFFMLADRDASPTSQDSGSFRVLNRYHLENYFLDAEILASCFSESEEPDSWLRSPQKIEEKLRDIAREGLGHAAALIVAKQIRDAVGNVDTMPKGIHNQNQTDFIEIFKSTSSRELHRVSESLDSGNVETKASEVYKKLASLLESDNCEWKLHFPGKPIFSKFCEAAQMQPGRMKTHYLTKSLISNNNPFAEVIEIFEDFSRA